MAAADVLRDDAPVSIAHLRQHFIFLIKLKNSFVGSNLLYIDLGISH
jgi:hypothetical protein